MIINVNIILFLNINDVFHFTLFDLLFMHDYHYYQIMLRITQNKTKSFKTKPMPEGKHIQAYT